MTPRDTLERQVKVLREGLEKIKRRVPIMGSRGDYRDGQMVALLACELVAIEALAESDRIEGEKSKFTETVKKAMDDCDHILRDPKMDDDHYPNPSGGDGFIKELQKLINRYSRENGSNTPDFILAEYLERCLLNFDETVTARSTFLSKGGGA